MRSIVGAIIISLAFADTTYDTYSASLKMPVIASGITTFVWTVYRNCTCIRRRG